MMALPLDWAVSIYRKSYLDENGCEIYVGQGIGDEFSPWGAYRRKPNGSLQRLKQLITWPDPHDAQKSLDEYAKKKNWREKPR